MKNCNEIQQILTELDSHQSIKDAAILKHIETCQACQDYQQNCEAMHHAFTNMNDFDADDALVESTLSSIVNLQETQQKPKRLLNTQWASALAASFMLISLIALFPYNSISEYGLDTESAKVIDQISSKGDEIKPKRIEKKLNESDFEFYDVDVADEMEANHRKAPSKDIDIQYSTAAPPKLESILIEGQSVGVNSISADRPEQESRQQFQDQLNINIKQNIKSELKKQKYIQTKAPAEKWSKYLEKQIVDDNSTDTDETCCEDDQDKVELERVITTGSRIRAVDLEEVTPVTANKDKREKVVPTATPTKPSDLMPLVQALSSDRNSEEFYNQSQQDDSLNSGNKSGLLIGKTTEEKGARRYRENTSNQPSTVAVNEQAAGLASPLNPAQKYLTALDSLENLTFQKATGYWANSYVPGDSQMRLLHMNLEQNNILGLDNSISQNVQPFDYPSNSALALYLNSDHAYVKGKQRMRLQVGIQAANRKGGHRTAMNIALVFDLSQTDADYAKKMKALLSALLKAKQPGDNISLTVAGAAGATLIQPEDFRQGSIQVALNQLFTDKNAAKAETLSLLQALQAATALLQQQDDASASLGSSVVLLITAADLDKLSAIENMAHENAVSGITMSTVSLLENNQEQLNKVALAGQGHTRILASVADAKRVVDAELLASSRAVGRALRLRIRLAKGVKLIKVLDSYNLNEQQTQSVRDAEQSIDQRLSKNLGITADRGEDEEGIQIVIPSFFAGDTHVVLLDVVVEKPGAIADVTLRYKDLLYLRNAIASKQLSIQSKANKLGPLQLNVMKNVLAHKYSEKIKLASDYIRLGNNKAALTELLSLQKLYKSMQAQFPNWHDDVEIINDEKLLQQYIKLLNANVNTDTKQLNYIADSMQYISWRKTITQTD